MTFSIIIPIYNAAAYLRQCIDSVLMAINELKCHDVDASAEVICVNDGSTDESEVILQSYGDDIVLLSQTNQGVSVARNKGLERATGEMVCFVDADDEVVPNWLIAYALKYDETKVDVILQKGFRWIYDGYPWSYAIRRECAICGRFPEGVTMGEDGLYAASIASHVKTMTTLADTTYRHVERVGSAMGRMLKSEERQRYLSALLSIARSYPSLSRNLLSAKVAAGIIYWLNRPADVVRSREIRKLWKELQMIGCTMSCVVALRFRFPYMVYAYTGMLWPIRFHFMLLRVVVCLKKMVV